MKKLYIFVGIILIVLLSGCSQSQLKNSTDQPSKFNSTIRETGIQSAITQESLNKCLSCCERSASKLVETSDIYSFCNYLCLPTENETIENLTEDVCNIEDIQGSRIKEISDILDSYENIN